MPPAIQCVKGHNSSETVIPISLYKSTPAQLSPKSAIPHNTNNIPIIFIRFPFFETVQFIKSHDLNRAIIRPQSN